MSTHVQRFRYHYSIFGGGGLSVFVYTVNKNDDDDDDEHEELRYYYFFVSDGVPPREDYFDTYERLEYDSCEIWIANGIPVDFHDRPAILCYSRENSGEDSGEAKSSWDLSVIMRYFTPGVNWHPDLPAYEEYNGGIVLHREWHDENESFHRVNGPAITSFLFNTYEYYLHNSPIQRADSEHVQEDSTPTFRYDGGRIVDREISSYFWEDPSIFQQHAAIDEPHHRVNTPQRTKRMKRTKTVKFHRPR